MSNWALRLYLLALMLLAAPASGAAPEPTSVPPHPLVSAAEALYQRNLPQACRELMRQAAMAPGLTDDDLIRLQFLTALQSFDEGDELGARRALARALLIDPSTAPPPIAAKFGKMLEEARALLSGPPLPGDRSARLAAARKAADQREPAPQVLLKAVDTLYTSLQIDGAGVVLDLARVSAAPVRAQVALRQGILKMEQADEEGARAAFKEVLEADRGISLPAYTPPKTLRVFEEVKRRVTAPVTPPESKRTITAAAEAPAPQSAKPAVPTTSPTTTGATGNALMNNSRSWGAIAGSTGLALIIGGAIAGAVGLSSYQAQQRAAASGDFAAFTQNRDAANAAINVADGLYVAGAVALGVGTYLFLRAPGEVSVGASAGPGRASLVIGGHF